jgi:hypothetical protein
MSKTCCLSNTVRPINGLSSRAGSSAGCHIAPNPVPQTLDGAFGLLQTLKVHSSLKMHSLASNCNARYRAYAGSWNVQRAAYSSSKARILQDRPAPSLQSALLAAGTTLAPVPKTVIVGKVRSKNSQGIAAASLPQRPGLLVTQATSK